MINHKIIIVEDEVLIAEDLKDILITLGFVNTYLAHDKKSGIELIDKIKPHLVLLDIRMEQELDGLDIANYINENHQMPFIFITAHSDMHTIKEIVKTSPAGYITKPFKKTDLYATINIALEKQLSKKQTQLKLKDGYETMVINHTDINYIESDGNYVTIFTTQKKYLSRQTLDSILSEINSSLFFKTHRSYVINMSKVQSYSKKDVTINNNVIPLSRNLVDDFEMKFKAI